MKPAITLTEFIAVVAILVLFIGVGYCVYEVTDLKYQALVVQAATKYQTQMDDITKGLNQVDKNQKDMLKFLDRQIKEGRLK